MGNQQTTQSTPSRSSQVRQNQPKKDMEKRNKNQNNQGQQGRNQSNQGRKPSNQGRGHNGADIKQAALPIGANPPNSTEKTQVVPFNSGEMVNQEIPNVSAGIIGIGTPVNPEAGAISNKIKSNDADKRLGANREAYFKNYLKKNKKAKSVKFVNLSCLEDKWKAYKNTDWGYDIPISSVNSALSGCVYKFTPNKPGKYDKYLRANPPMPPEIPVQSETPVQTNPVPFPPNAVPTQTDTVVPSVQSEAVAITAQNATPDNVIVQTVPVPVAVSNPVVEKFMIDVNSNNQNFRYFMSFMLVILIIFIIILYLKNKEKKL